jgi:hypothetical protein
VAAGAACPPAADRNTIHTIDGEDTIPGGNNTNAGRSGLCRRRCSGQGRRALACVQVCREFNRLDLLHAVVGMDPAQARQFLIDSMWSRAFDRARATQSWMPR